MMHTRSRFYYYHERRANEGGRNGERNRGMCNMGWVRVREKSTRGRKLGRWGIKENGHVTGIKKYAGAERGERDRLIALKIMPLLSLYARPGVGMRRI